MIDKAPRDQIRTVTISPIGLEGLFGRPPAANGIVLFAHGSGSGRLSPRNDFVARALRESGLATLLFDLLTEDEASDRRNVFDIELLAQRLLMATSWARDGADTADLPIGYFGASTGAAAALVAAAAHEGPVAAVVSRGGRPDLAGPALRAVTAPTLLIVGGDDVQVLALNRAALAELACEKQLVVVPGATHLFEEPGTLEAVVEHARGWFLAHFGKPGR
jgi:putative phosphoribosyl transferase